jgi:hypothetical protein
MKKLDQVLLKLQTTFGTAEGSLTTTDVAEIMEGGVVGFTPNTTAIRLLGSGFSQNASVVGPSVGELTLRYPLRSGGNGDPGQWTLPLQCCGWKESDAADVYTYEQTSKMSEFKDATVWGYTGNRDTSKSLKRIISNTMYNAKFILDFRPAEAVAYVEFTGQGVYSGAPSAATQLAITKDTTSINALKGVTLNFFGDTDYDPLLLEFDLGRVVSVTTDGTDSTGLGFGIVSDGSATWHAIIYKSVDALAETAYANGTTGTISVSWGTEPNKITLATGASKAQITEVSDAEEGEVETYDLTGIIIDNDFSVEVDTSTT